MIHYFIEKEGHSVGPFTLEELKSQRLKRTTRVWKEGMLGWDKAGNIPELEAISAPEPPPLPREEPEITENPIITETHKSLPKQSDKYDPSHPKAELALVAGLVLMLLNLIVYFYYLDFKEDSYDYLTESEISSIRLKAYFSTLVLRIAITVWVIRIAKSLNRTSAWGILAFGFPGPSLIVIGLLKKLRFKPYVNPTWSNEQNVRMLFDELEKFKSQKKRNECIEIANTILNIESENSSALWQRAALYFEEGLFEKAEQDLRVLLSMNLFIDKANLLLGKIHEANKDLNQAIKYWEQSKEEEALQKIARYKKLHGQFLLKQNECFRKLETRTSKLKTELTGVKLKLSEKIEVSHLINSSLTHLQIFDKGILVELLKPGDDTYIAIWYAEMTNVNFKDNTFSIEMKDGSKLVFDYDLTRDYNKNAETLLNQFNSQMPENSN